MTYASILILAFAHLMPWIKSNNLKLGKNPAKLISTMSGAMIFPYFIILLFSPSSSSIYNLVPHYEFIRLLTKFSILYSLSILFIQFGIYAGSNIHFSKSRNIINNKINYNTYSNASYLLFLISITFIVIKIFVAGGLLYVIDNIKIRGEIFSGTAYLDLIITPSSYLCAFFGIYSNSINKSPKNLTLFLMIGIMAIMMAAFGGRKSTMMLVILSITVNSIYNKKSNLLSIKNIFIYVLIAIFFIYALQFRINSQLGDNSYEITFTESIKNSSYIDIYLFIIKHFEINNFWYGVGYLDIIHRFIPIYSNQIYPPIDDGLYIRSILEGMVVKPPMSVNELYPSSWPPETFGSGYMNFGILGIILFSILKGIVSGLTLRLAKANQFSPIPLFILIYTALNFHISNLRIIQFLIILAGISIIILPSLVRKIKINNPKTLNS